MRLESKLQSRGGAIDYCVHLKVCIGERESCTARKGMYSNKQDREP